MSDMSFPPNGYLVVTATDRFNLEEDVKDRMEEGWKLQGGIAISWSPTANDEDSCLLYAQAMTQTAKLKGGIGSSEKDVMVELGEAIERLDDQMQLARPGKVTVIVRDKDAFADMFAFEIKTK